MERGRRNEEERREEKRGGEQEKDKEKKTSRVARRGRRECIHRKVCSVEAK